MPLSDADRFAELIETDPPRHPALPDARSDRETAELLTLVASLRGMDFDVELSELTKGRQRQRLVAMAAVRTSESADSVAVGRHRAISSRDGTEQVGGWSQLLARLREGESGRRLIAGLAGVSVIVATLAILALLAQSAIPGDTLYALKRGTEQARLALAVGEREQGRVLLGFATTRLEEMDQLLDEPVALRGVAAGVQAAAADDMSELLVATMDTMDQQTTDGTNAMTTAAVDDTEVELLSIVGEWGVAQFEALDALSARMPDAAQDRAEESKDLLQEIVQRLDGLAKDIDCECLDEPLAVDALGPIPCEDCVDPTPNGSGDAQSLPSSPGQADPSADPSPSVEQTVPETSPPPGTGSPDPGEPIPPVIPTIPPPVPPLEGSSCFIGVEIGIIVGGVCVPIPVIPPPPPPNEGQPCILVDLPWPLDDIMGIYIGGICVIG